jgi:MSHA pilin protein MshC
MHSRRPNGFTLVELIATLIIIALIAVVGGSRFFDINVFRASGFYDETISAVRYAQKLAVETHCEVRVNITATGYALFSAANAAGCGSGTYNTPVADPSGNAANFARTAPSGVTLAPATNIIFAPDGSAALTPDPITINVGSHSLRVYGETGFVQRL